MDIIDGELQRTDQYREQLTKRKKGGELGTDPAKLQQDYERNLKKYQAVIEKQDQVSVGAINTSTSASWNWQISTFSRYLLA